jgi:hypothetical protein
VKDTDVTVTAFMPGPTDTDFFRRADMGDTKIGTTDKDDPADVAQQAFDAITHGQGKKVTGSLKTKAQGLANKVLPDGTKADAHGASVAFDGRRPWPCRSRTLLRSLDACEDHECDRIQPCPLRRRGRPRAGCAGGAAWSAGRGGQARV